MLKYAYNIADNMLHGIRDNIYLLSKKRIGSFIYKTNTCNYKT